MIWESGPWKEQLARRALDLERRKVQRHWVPASFAKVEEHLFLAAYAIRKLLEAKKLSDECEAQPVRGVAYAPTGRAVDLMNWHKLEHLYELSIETSVSLALGTFCNLIIHSFVFATDHHDAHAGLQGVYVTSDYERGRALYYFSIEEVVEVLRRVASDAVLVLEMERSPTTGEVKVIRKSNQPSVDHA